MNLSILSVGEGDLTIRFDGKNQADKDKAASLVKDLLRKGYALMAQVGSNEKGPLFQRVVDFDADTQEYIVIDVPGEAPKAPLHSVTVAKPRGRPRKRVSSATPATAVARTAGGYDPNIVRNIKKGVRL